MKKSPLLESEIFSQPLFLNSPWLACNIDWSVLKQIGIRKHFKKNAIIYSDIEPSQCIYYISQGRVRTSVFTEAGEEKIIMVVDEGNIIDMISAIDGLPNYLVSTAVTESILYRVEKEVFLKLVHEDIKISNKVISDLTSKMRILITQIEDLTFMTSTARIAKCLYRLSHEYGRPFNDGIKLNIKFTHQEMAIYAGTCRVTASNILRNMEKAGIIKRNDGYVIIKDIIMLKFYIESNYG
ncbi:Crp/Fnr family transcriptional regulator [Desulfosporosinus burensis]